MRQNIVDDGNDSSRTDILDDVLVFHIFSPGKYQDSNLKTDELRHPQKYMKSILV